MNSTLAPTFLSCLRPSSQRKACNFSGSWRRKTARCTAPITLFHHHIISCRKYPNDLIQIDEDNIKQSCCWIRISNFAPLKNKLSTNKKIERKSIQHRLVLLLFSSKKKKPTSCLCPFRPGNLSRAWKHWPLWFQLSSWLTKWRCYRVQRLAGKLIQPSQTSVFTDWYFHRKLTRSNVRENSDTPRKLNNHQIQSTKYNKGK